jgi:TM2 domain-containing membrane protein YozV
MTTSNSTTPPPLPQGASGKFCSACGNPIHTQAEICPSCGVRQRKGADKTALALLAFFLGGLGAHKFYVGKYGQGVLYLLFCWTGIPGLIAFIEFIIYLCTPGEEISQKYTSKGAGVVVAFVVCIFGFIMITGILAAIAIPNFIAYRDKAVCGQVEEAAGNYISAISQFYAGAGNTHVPTPEELFNATGLRASENVTVLLGGENGQIVLQAYHNNGTCSQGENFVVLIEDEIYSEWQ